MTIREPKPGERISAREGVNMEGATSGLAEGESLWVFDYDAGGEWRYWFVNEEPIAVDAAGEWRQVNQPIGEDSDEIGTKYEIILVVADSQCGLTLRTAGPNPEGDLALKALPPGCQVFASVTVVKGRR